MKSIKFILPAMAFVLAIGTALASDVFFINDARGTSGVYVCVLGNLEVPFGKTCSVTNDDVRCQVRIEVGEGSQLVPAFKPDTQCFQALYYEN